MRILFPIICMLLTSPLFCQLLEVEGALDVKNNQIKNVADPTDPQDVVTKAYVDQMSERLLNAGINGVVQDIDGNVYKTIKIGTQVWMAENLKTTRYNDGTPVPKVMDDTEWSNLSTPGYCWYNYDSTLNAKVLGALYNYYTVADSNTRNVCPLGWDVPTDAEWNELKDFLTNNGYGYEGSGGDIAKSMAATSRWTSLNPMLIGVVGNDQGTNNSSGFSGLPGGQRQPSGTFMFLGQQAYWWTSTTIGPVSVFIRGLWWHESNFINGTLTKTYGLSVRCLRD